MLFFYCLSGFIVSLVFIKDLFSVSFLDIAFILIKSGIIVFNWLLVMKALKKLDVGIVVSFSLLNTILVVFGSHFIYKEKLSLVHFISLIIISIGVIFISRLDKKDSKEKETKERLIPFGILILSCLLGSASVLFDKYLLNVREISSRSVLVWCLLFNTIIYGVIYFCKNKKIEFKVIKNNYWVVFTGVGIAMADILYYYSINVIGAQLSIISIVRKLSVVVATLGASIFLHEKGLFKKLLILGLMLIGVALPVVFN